MLPSLPGRQRVMRIAVSMPIQFRPPDRFILVPSPTFHTPDSHANETKYDRADADRDTNDGAGGNGGARAVILLVAVTIVGGGGSVG